MGGAGVALVKALGSALRVVRVSQGVAPPAAVDSGSVAPRSRRRQRAPAQRAGRSLALALAAVASVPAWSEGVGHDDGAAGRAAVAAGAPLCDVLLLDLEGDGLFLTDRFYPVSFDYGRGPEASSWTAPGRDAAFLWLDANGDGRVSGIGELVGSCFAGESEDAEQEEARPDRPAADGFARLAAYDAAAHGGNRNGRLDPGDRLWSRLRLWADRDHDAAVGAGELATFEDREVVEIALEAEPSLRVDGGLNRHHRRGSFQRAEGGRGGVPDFSLGTVTAVLFDRPSLDEGGAGEVAATPAPAAARP
jgi:hypothetical protein